MSVACDHQEPVSRPILEALIAQKKESRLNSPALEKWVQRFEVSLADKGTVS
jgi:hypothetical protein